MENIKAQAIALKPMMTVGKNGLTENSINQIKLHLKAHKLSKVKFLRSFLENQEMSKKEIAQDVATKLGAELVHFVGFTAVYYKR